MWYRLFLQGGTTDDALQAGLLGGIGGAIGGQLGGATGSDAVKMTGADLATKTAPKFASDLSLQAGPKTFAEQMALNKAQNSALASSMSTQAPSFLSALGSPTAIGTGIGASFAPPPPMKKEEDDFVAPRGKNKQSRRNA